MDDIKKYIKIIENAQLNEIEQTNFGKHLSQLSGHLDRIGNKIRRNRNNTTTKNKPEPGADLTSTEINSIFNIAAKSREPNTKNKRIINNNKPVIPVDQLVKKWKTSGYPPNGADISEILSSAGFDDDEIRNIYDKAGLNGNTKSSDQQPQQGQQNQNTQSTTSDAADKVASYIKKENMTDDVINFMKTTYGFSESIFKDEPLLHEHRENLPVISRNFEITNLGRTRK